MSLKKPQNGVTAPAGPSLDELFVGTRVVAALAEVVKVSLAENEAVPAEVAKVSLAGNEAVPAEPSAEASGEPTVHWRNFLAVDCQNVEGTEVEAAPEEVVKMAENEAVPAEPSVEVSGELTVHGRNLAIDYQDVEPSDAPTVR